MATNNKQTPVDAVRDAGAIGVAMFGVDAAKNAIYAIISEHEMLLRATQAPDHPALVFLDEYREEQKADEWKKA